MDEQEINKYRVKLKDFCTSTSLIVTLLVALTCICGYVIGLLIWWEPWDI